MGKFDLFNKFNTAVLVINKKKEVVFQNNFFKRIFSDYENLKKFSHKLNYNVCALVSNDVEVHSPILQALKSPEDFSAYVSYQSAKNEISYFDMSATSKSGYLIITFTDVTSQTIYSKLELKNLALQKKINLLEEDNKNLMKIKQHCISIITSFFAYKLCPCKHIAPLIITAKLHVAIMVLV